MWLIVNIEAPRKLTIIRGAVHTCLVSSVGYERMRDASVIEFTIRKIDSKTH